MALVAGHAAGMLGGHNLGKSSWLGGVFFVATPAEVGDVGQLRNVGHRVIGVFRQWAVAGFASDVRVTTGCASFAFVLMTEQAGILAGKGHGVCASGIQRRRPVVAILPECLGNHYRTDDQENAQRGQQNQRRPEKMARIMEKLAQEPPPFSNNCCLDRAGGVLPPRCLAHRALATRGPKGLLWINSTD